MKALNGRGNRTPDSKPGEPVAQIVNDMVMILLALEKPTGATILDANPRRIPPPEKDPKLTPVACGA